MFTSCKWYTVPIAIGTNLKLTLKLKKVYLKMYNSVIECGKSIKIYIIGLKKRLVWAVFERCDSIEDIQRVIKS